MNVQERESHTPAAFVLWHRAHAKGAKWRKVGVFATSAEATNAVDGPGDWWTAVVRDARLAAATEPADAPDHTGTF